MNLGTFVDKLIAERQLYVLQEPVNPVLEMAAITQMEGKSSSNKALLFNKVCGSKVKMVTNLFGTEQRIAAALGCRTLTDFRVRLQQSLVEINRPDSATALQKLTRQSPRQRLSAAEATVEKDLSFLPQMRFWPQEERTFLTLAVVITRSASDNSQNYGLYRVGISDATTLTLNLLPGSQGGQHLREWQAIAHPMPVAIVLGADPSLIFAAAASLPSACDESSFSAFLQRQPFACTAAASVPLEIPLSAQIIIEGWVRINEVENEGPFGCFRGNYGGRNFCPLVQISAIRRCSDPLIALTLAGPLPTEDCWLARANHEVLRARLAIDLPHLELLDLPLETAFHGLYYVHSSQPELGVADIAAQLQDIGYFNRLQMLIKLDPDSPMPTDSNWRKIYLAARPEQMWRLPSAELDELLRNTPASLGYPPDLLRKSAQRLSVIHDAYAPN